MPYQYKDIPNESIYLDRHGHLFVGKTNGLSVVEGSHSYHLQMHGPVYVTGGDSDTLFYACENDAGYLVMNDSPSYHPVSRSYWIPSSQRNFTPSGLISYQKDYFINSDRGIFFLSGGRSKLFSFHGANTQLYPLDEKLFLTVEGTGVMSWSGSEFTLLVPEDQLGNNPVVLLGTGTGNLQILTSVGGLYSMSGSGAPPSLEANLSSMEKITFMANIGHGHMLADVEGRGISILDQRGNLVTRLGTGGELPDNEIKQLFIQEDHEIWILSSHALHKINYPSPLNVLDLKSLETGAILTSMVTKEGMFLGTGGGLFKLEQADPVLSQFSLTALNPGNRGSVHLLDSSGTALFAAGFNQLSAIRHGALEIMDEGIFTGIRALNSNSLIASGEKGLFRYDRTETGWKKSPLDPSLTTGHSFVSFDNHIFFLCRNGVYRFGPGTMDVEPIPFHRDELLQRLDALDGELYLVGDTHVYVYEKGEDAFLPMPWDKKAEILSGSEMILPGNEGDYWILKNNGKYSSRIIQTRKLDELEEDYSTFPVLQNLGEIINLSARDSLLFITGKDKICLFDLRELKSYAASISLHIEKLESVDRDAEFYLSGLEFQSMPDPLFRYRLLPGKEIWSGWDQRRNVTLNNLRQGNYKIVAQARDLYGRVSEPVEMEFTIHPPLLGTWYAYIVYSFIFLVGLFLFRKLRLLGYRRAESRISQRMQDKLDDMAIEKEKSDKLVAEILPEKTLSQLKDKGRAKWDKYERATVLFSDIQGFTQIAEEMNPEALIDELDKFFFHFDSVVEKYNIEKIKTIGDAYMAAGGIPEKNSTNPVEVVLAALEMQSYMQHLKSSRAKIWDLRIGIHTGPVIAGVVGHKKVSYDIWGDTVNTASRMESSGTAGKVNISGITYQLVKDYFLCEYRGKLPVKYKGKIDMYYVNGLRPELAVDLKEIPNKRFFTKLQLLRLGDLEEKVFGEILKDLPEILHFHNLEYARKVYDQAMLLCRAEEVYEEERLVVLTAALMLLTGLTQSFHTFENRSAVISREILPDFKYTEAQIDQVCNLILSTKLPLAPNNRLEQVMIDAKMEYIGNPDYTTQIKLLFQEMKDAGSKINGQQFKKQQLELLFEFEYFTVSARRLREVSGKDQIATLELERWI